MLRPVRFELDKDAEVFVEERGEGQWAIVQHGFTLNAHGAWAHEPLPSSRTPEYLKANRWSTPEACETAYTAAKADLARWG